MNIGPEIEKGLAPGALSLLRRLGELAEETGVALFIVGGAVRDIILRGSCSDIDCVVEGDAVAFAKKAAPEMNARSHSHEAFGTAALELPDGIRIDLATARSETYSSPGALPDVAPASIEKDLFRRDFTINAMAARLTPGNFGELYDPFNGRALIVEGLLKVIHEKSFVDDPTRILRGIRFAGRLGFKFDDATEQLLRDALTSGALDTVSGQRIKKEIEYCFSENKRKDIVSLLKKYGIERSLAPGIVLDESILPASDDRENLPAAVAEGLMPQEIETARPWLACFAAAAYGNDKTVLESLSERLNLIRAERDVLLGVSRPAADMIMEILSDPGSTPSETAGKMETLPLESILAFFMAGGETARKNIRKYLQHTRHVSLEITGDDLEEMGLAPCPKTGKILKKLLEIKRDGVIRDRQGELSEAKRMIEME